MAKFAGLQQFKVVKTNGRHVKEIVIWDQVSNCQGEDCPVYEECHFIKSGKCSLESEYLEALCKMIYRLENQEKFSEVTIFAAGLHIVPLYRHLFKFKLIEIGLGGNITVGTGAKLKMHPVYKEIRETVKTIMNLWKDIGLMDKYEMPSPEIKLAGSNMYYDALSVDEEDLNNPEQ